MQGLYAHGFILQGFDWRSWDEGRRHGRDLPWIARADLETLCRLFTAHVRNDRFCEGHLAAMWYEGVIEAMVERLREVGEETESGRDLA